MSQTSGIGRRSRTRSPPHKRQIVREDLGRADVSEAVAGVIAKSLSGSNAKNVLDRLVRNTTNVQVYQYIDVTSYALLANLPADVVRILPWSGVVSGATGAAPEGFSDWFLNRLIEVGQLFYRGLVALFTFLADLAAAIADWGMRFFGAVSQAVGGVAQVVADALATLLTWIQNLAINAFTAVVDGFKGLLQAAVKGIIDSIVSVAKAKPTLDGILFGLPVLGAAILRGREILERLFIALEVVEGGLTTALAILTGGAAAFVKMVVASVTKEAVLKAVMGAVLAAAALSIAVTWVDAFDEPALNSLGGQVFKGVLGGVALAGATLDYVKARKEAQASGATKWASAAAFALWGLVAELFGGDALTAALDSAGVTNPFARGLSLLALDAMALMSAGYGLYLLFKKVPGEPLLKAVRKVLASITDSIENAITLLGFFGTTSSVGIHAGNGDYVGQW